jgi:hypothetical protein
VPSLASAEETLVNWARHRVEDGLVKPLAKLESTHFGRSRPPPRERRVRVLASTLSHDKSGDAFVPFAIDSRFGGDEWSRDFVGCAYRESGNLFVKIGNAYRPAEILLQKPAEPVAGVCEAVTKPSS